ncbi:MAG: hypothetical protein COB50_03725, partial [Thiotrichales bacterium]
PSILATALATLGMLLLLAPKAIPARYLAIFMTLPLLFNPINHVKKNSMQITLLDSGKGLITVIRHASTTVLFESKNAYMRHINLNRSIVMPYLRGTGINTIDTFFNFLPSFKSHAAVNSLQQYFSIKKTSFACENPNVIHVGKLLFTKLDTNNHCSLLVSYGNKNILITSAITRALINHPPLAITLLITSDQKHLIKLLQHIQIKYLLLPNLANSRLADIKKHFPNIKIFTTKQLGTVKLMLNVDHLHQRHSTPTNKKLSVLPKS